MCSQYAQLTDIAMVRGLYDPAERNIPDVLCVEDSAEASVFVFNLSCVAVCCGVGERERD